MKAGSTFNTTPLLASLGYISLSSGGSPRALRPGDEQHDNDGMITQRSKAQRPSSAHDKDGMITQQSKAGPCMRQANHDFTHETLEPITEGAQAGLTQCVTQETSNNGYTTRPAVAGRPDGHQSTEAGAAFTTC